MAIALDSLPKPAVKNISLRVKPAAERALREGHPWVFEDAITRQSHLGNAGDLAVIYEQKRNRFLAVGLYDPLFPIRVKVLQARDPKRIDVDFFTEKLQEAQALRRPLIQAGNTGYRLVFGESDGFPSLVLDRYGNTLVLKLYSTAWMAHLHSLLPALEAATGFDGLVLRLSRALQSTRLNVARLYGLQDGQVLFGTVPAMPLRFVENGLQFQADVQRGHKTGFFFDQRENRQRVRELARGRRVLDVFSYSGAFTVYALAGGARRVTALDLSEPALAALGQNVALNGFEAERVDLLAEDAFRGLQELIAANRKFSMVILDPPAFANSRAKLQRAVLAYRRLLEMALRLLTDGGLLFMASCSSRINEESFYQLILRTAEVSGYRLDILARTTHALDHPIRFAEAEYLKAVFAKVRK